MQPSRVRIALLDRLDDAVADTYHTALPSGWELIRSTSYDEVDQIAAAAEADVLFISWTAATRAVMEATNRLVLVQKLGVGTDRVDFDYCRGRGIAVARLAGVNAVPVAEHVVLLMLAVLRQLPRSDRRIRAGEWFKEEARSFQRELRDRRIGLIGLGYVGRAVAARLRPFDVHLAYHDPRRLPPEEESALGLTYRALDELIAESEILSLHLPLSPSTANLLDEGRIRAMRPGAYLVNCARGGLVDESALQAALRDGHLAGAALDCFADEPVGENGLLTLDSVVATPHVAGATVDNVAHVARRAYANVRSYLAGEGLPVEDVVYLPQHATGRDDRAAIGGTA